MRAVLFFFSLILNSEVQFIIKVSLKSALVSFPITNALVYYCLPILLKQALNCCLCFQAGRNIGVAHGIKGAKARILALWCLWGNFFFFKSLLNLLQYCFCFF